MAIVFDSIEGFFKFYLKTLWRRSLVWIVQTSRLIPLTFHYLSNQPNSVSLSHKQPVSAKFLPAERGQWLYEFRVLEKHQGMEE